MGPTGAREAEGVAGLCAGSSRAAWEEGESKASERTVAFAGLPVVFNVQSLAILVRIYFDIRNEDGNMGDVIYLTRKGVAYVTLREKKGAEDIIKKRKHCLAEKIVAHYHSLWYNEKVFCSESAILDFKVFWSQVIPQHVINDLQKEIPNSWFGPLESSERITVQGSFLAIKRLHESLLQASSLLEK
ncbi:LOW QUALITY PROTEIN: RNA-binding protein 43 [Rhynchocyon petersi]